MTTDVTAGRDEILAAVAARQADTEELLIELVAAPTLLGDELPGQRVMRDAFEALGLPTRMQSLDGAALSEHPLASPFSWDVSGKANVVADWDPTPGSERRGRSLILNGHIDVVAPGRRRLALRPRRRRHEVRPGRLRRRGCGSARARPGTAGASPAAVGGRG